MLADLSNFTTQPNTLSFINISLVNSLLQDLPSENSFNLAGKNILCLHGVNVYKIFPWTLSCCNSIESHPINTICLISVLILSFIYAKGCRAVLFSWKFLHQNLLCVSYFPRNCFVSRSLHRLCNLCCNRDNIHKYKEH